MALKGPQKPNCWSRLTSSICTSAYSREHPTRSHVWCSTSTSHPIFPKPITKMLHHGRPSRARTNRCYVASCNPHIFSPQISTPVRWPDLSLRFYLLSDLSLSSISPSWSLWLSSPSRTRMLASQGVLASCWRSRWCLCSPGRGCAPSRPPCSPVAPRAGTHSVLLSRPRTSARPVQCLRWSTSELHVSSPTSAPALSSVTMSLHSFKQQGDIVPDSACYKRMFQMIRRCVASVTSMLQK
jgi:hypothetical protein